MATNSNTEVAPWADPSVQVQAAPDQSSEVAPWNDPTVDTTPQRDDIGQAAHYGDIAMRGIMKGTAQLAQFGAEVNPFSISGLAEKAGMVSSATGHGQPANPAPYKPALSDFVHPEKWQQAAEYFADQMDLDKPETPAEKVGEAAISSIPAGVAAGPEAVLPAMVGSGASQAVQNAGGGPIAQTVAGIAAPLAGPAGVGALRGIVRGTGEINAQAMQGRIAQAQEAMGSEGPGISLGEASNNEGIKMAEKASGALWGGGPLVKQNTAQNAALNNRVQGIIENLKGDNIPNPEAAGKAIQTGVDATNVGMRTAEDQAYQKVQDLLPPGATIPVGKTAAVLHELTAPIPGMKATSQGLTASPIKTLAKNFQADLDKSRPLTPTGQQLAAIRGNTPNQLSFQGLRELRTKIGNSIDWGLSPNDPQTNGALKRIYGAISEDLGTGAGQVSPELDQAYKAANSLYAANSAKRDLLSSVVDKAGGTEGIFQAATNQTKNGASKIRTVMDSIDPDAQNLVRATTLDRMGRQGASGDFDYQKFLSNWQKLDGSAKDALFGNSGPPNTLRSALDSISGTASSMKQGVGKQGLVGRLGHTAGLAILFEAGSKAAEHIINHGIGTAALGLGATALSIGANRALASALTSPRLASWMAQTTKLPTNQIPNAILQLSKSQNPDDKNLANTLMQGNKNGS